MAEKNEVYKYDKFLPLGHLSLYKNTLEVNDYYLLSNGPELQDYNEVFTSDRHFGFDENIGIYKVFLKYNFPVFIKRIYGDISTIHKRFTLSERVYQVIDKNELLNINYKKQVFYYEKGKVFRAYQADDGSIEQEELIYVHHRVRKLNNDYEDECLKTNAWFITEFGYIPKKNAGIPTIEEITRLNPYKGVIYEKLEDAKYYGKKRREFYMAVVKNKIKKYT